MRLAVRRPVEAVAALLSVARRLLEALARLQPLWQLTAVAMRLWACRRHRLATARRPALAAAALASTSPPDAMAAAAKLGL